MVMCIIRKCTKFKFYVRVKHQSELFTSLKKKTISFDLLGVKIVIIYSKPHPKAGLHC